MGSGNSSYFIHLNAMTRNMIGVSSDRNSYGRSQKCRAGIAMKHWGLWCHVNRVSDSLDYESLHRVEYPCHHHGYNSDIVVGFHVAPVRRAVRPGSTLVALPFWTLTQLELNGESTFFSVGTDGVRLEQNTASTGREKHFQKYTVS